MRLCVCLRLVMPCSVTLNQFISLLPFETLERLLTNWLQHQRKLHQIMFGLFFLSQLLILHLSPSGKSCSELWLLLDVWWGPDTWAEKSAPRVLSSRFQTNQFGCGSSSIHGRPLKTIYYPGKYAGEFKAKNWRVEGDEQGKAVDMDYYISEEPCVTDLFVAAWEKTKCSIGLSRLYENVALKKRQRYSGESEPQVFRDEW